jgi:hypothetical protein
VQLVKWTSAWLSFFSIHSRWYVQINWLSPTKGKRLISHLDKEIKHKSKRWTYTGWIVAFLSCETYVHNNIIMHWPDLPSPNLWHDHLTIRDQIRLAGFVTVHTLAHRKPCAGDGDGTYVNVRGERLDGLYSWRQANRVTVIWPRSVSCRRGARPLWLVPAGEAARGDRDGWDWRGCTLFVCAPNEGTKTDDWPSLRSRVASFSGCFG